MYVIIIYRSPISFSSSIDSYRIAFRLFQKGQLGANVLGANQINYNKFIIQIISVVPTEKKKEKNQNTLTFC